MKLPPKRFLMVAAAATMLSLSAACGAGGDKAAICEKATKALQEFGQTATTSSSGNFDAFNSAAKKLGSELETLAGQADGELKTTLSSMATAWGSLQVDTSDLLRILSASFRSVDARRAGRPRSARRFRLSSFA
jgi:hypothetical protein